jgi:hypothetical protein
VARALSEKLAGCWKVAYDSPRQARLAHRHARFRIRPYLCERCWKYHVAAGDKRSK